MRVLPRGSHLRPGYLVAQDDSDCLDLFHSAGVMSSLAEFDCCCCCRVVALGLVPCKLPLQRLQCRKLQASGKFVSDRLLSENIPRQCAVLCLYQKLNLPPR